MALSLISMRKVALFKSPNLVRTLMVAVVLSPMCIFSVTYSNESALSQSIPAPKLGQPVDDELVRQWDTTVFADGSGLPSGSGNATQGKSLYKLHCLACHGPGGEGALAEELVPPLCSTL